MIKIKQFGGFEKLEKFIKKARQKKYLAGLEKYGEAGITALAKATPIDSGVTALSWGYRIEEIENGYRIVWYNTHISNYAVIAILLQYGHATGNGGYVQGTDYVNPAMRTIFEELAENAWREVTE
jgi:hypothetical protein